MGDGRAEAHEAVTEKDGREDEDVGDVLTAMVRVVVDVEIAGLQRLGRIELGASAEGCPDGAELHGNQLRLAHHVAVHIQQGGGAVVRFPHDRRVGRTHELDAHLFRGGDQRLGDDRLVDLIERHWSSLSWLSVLPSALSASG